VTEPGNDPADLDPLVQGVRVHRDREQRRQREGEPAVARRLAQIGVLGWIVVVPTLAGIFIGRWLDQKFNSGLFCTAPLLMLSAALGFWSAWRWMQSA
jgi:ATP synthase protein I